MFLSLFLVFHSPPHSSSGSQCCWFYSGGGGCYSELSASGLLCWWSMRFMLMVSSFLTAGTTWYHFSMFGKTLDLSLSSLFCNSTLHLIFAIHSCFYGIRYYLFVIFVTSKTGFVQLLVGISLTDPWWAVYSHGPHCQACPPSHPLYSSVPHPLSPLLQVPAVIPDCYISSTQSHYISGKYLILYRITACCCSLCKAVVVPNTNKNKTE